MAFYVSIGPRYIPFRVGMIWTGVTGSLTYWWTNRRRPAIRAVTKDRAIKGELKRIRRACVELGADQEMTELVLASHRHDRTLLDVMTANGNDLRDYVQHKLAVWEAIFDEQEERPPLSHNGCDSAFDRVRYRVPPS